MHNLIELITKTIQMTKMSSTYLEMSPEIT